MWNVLVVAIYLPVAVGSMGWIAWREGSWHAGVWALIGPSPSLDVWIGLGPALGVVAATRWASSRLRFAGRMSAAMARVVGPVSGWTTLWLAAASALGEELLFRGALQPSLGLVATSLLFAAVHVPLERDLALWPTFALGAGLLLGGMAEATGALLAPVVCHFSINLWNLRHLSGIAAQDEEGFFQ